VVINSIHFTLLDLAFLRGDETWPAAERSGIGRRENTVESPPPRTTIIDWDVRARARFALASCQSPDATI